MFSRILAAASLAVLCLFLSGIAYADGPGNGGGYDGPGSGGGYNLLLDSPGSGGGYGR